MSTFSGCWWAAATGRGRPGWLRERAAPAARGRCRRGTPRRRRRRDWRRRRAPPQLAHLAAERGEIGLRPLARARARRSGCAAAARLVRLIDFYEDAIEELRVERGGEGEDGSNAGGGGAAAPPPAGSRERAQADLASLRRQVRELRRRSALAVAAAGQLGLELVVPLH